MVRYTLLVVLLSLLPTSFLLGNPQSLKITSGYLELSQLHKLYRELNVSWDPLTLIAEVKYQNRVVRFKPEEKFYISGPLFVSLEKPARLYKGKVWLSQELVEEILTELKLPLRYVFLPSELQVTIDKPIDKPMLDPKLPSSIVLDAGHGGRDPGAFGVFGVSEKDITLETTLELARYLKKVYPKTKVVLTRSKDKFLSLEERSQIANRYFSNEKNTIFISLHCNATLSPRIRGFEVYYLAVNPLNTLSRETELRENKIEGSRYLRALASRLIHASIQFESKLLARAMERAMSVHLKGKVESRGVKKADFAVLRGALMPSILIELGYLTNRQEVLVLQSPEFRAAFNQAVALAIREYSKRLP